MNTQRLAIMSPQAKRASPRGEVVRNPVDVISNGLPRF